LPRPRLRWQSISAPTSWAAATMIIYAVALIVGLVKIRSLCARYANSRQKSWVTRGLRLVRWEAGISFGYTCVFLAGVIAPIFGTAIPYWHAAVVPATTTSISLIIAFTGPLVDRRPTPPCRHTCPSDSETTLGRPRPRQSPYRTTRVRSTQNRLPTLPPRGRDPRRHYASRGVHHTR
jgi:hypothetical protein